MPFDLFVEICFGYFFVPWSRSLLIKKVNKTWLRLRVCGLISLSYLGLNKYGVTIVSIRHPGLRRPTDTKIQPRHFGVLVALYCLLYRGRNSGSNTKLSTLFFRIPIWNLPVSYLHYVQVCFRFIQSKLGNLISIFSKQMISAFLHVKNSNAMIKTKNTTVFKNRTL
jgi:hypothetical protein